MRPRRVKTRYNSALANEITKGFRLDYSEKSLRSWLGTKLDKDIELMEMISTGRFSETRAGSYLRSLRSSFPAELVGDMLSLLYLSLELSARAKGDLMLREAGFSPALDPSLPAKFKELAYLEKNIGRAGKLALAPLLSTTTQDLWEIYMLKQGGAVAGDTGSEKPHGQIVNGR